MSNELLPILILVGISALIMLTVTIVAATYWRFTLLLLGVLLGSQLGGLGAVFGFLISAGIILIIEVVSWWANFVLDLLFGKEEEEE